MRSPALAIAWEFGRRHRWGLIALAVYPLIVLAIKLILGPEHGVRLDPPNGTAALVMIPLSAAFIYFLAVFSFGLGGDLATRQSLYPARMFTLPVTTMELAGWPMLYGAVAMVSLWLTTAFLARWPWGIDLPWVWPGLLFAVFLAWTQVLTWKSYGLRGLRVIAAVLFLPALDTVMILAIEYEIPEPLMVAFLAPQLPLAYLAAYFAVAHARHGDVPDWREAFARLGRTVELRRSRGHFPSPDRAQLWFEWRWQGRSLPTWVAILLPFELALLFITDNDTPVLVFTAIVLVLLTPPVMAVFAAAAGSRSNPGVRDSYGVTPFLATRPMTNVALVAAKVKMAIWSTLAAWLLVLTAIALALTLSDTWPIVVDWSKRGIEAVGMGRAIAIALLVFTGLLASTWKQLVQSLCIGLTGREWVIKSSVFLALTFLVLIGLIAPWIIESLYRVVTLWDWLPWIAAVLICFKMSAAAWVAMRLQSNGLLSDRALVIGAASWSVAALGLYALLVSLFASPLIPSYLFGLLAILGIPLVRLSAAPLSLDWNRHR